MQQRPSSGTVIIGTSVQPCRKSPDGLVLLHELGRALNLDTGFTSLAASPCFHTAGVTHGYVPKFLHGGSTEEVSRPVYGLVKCPNYSVLLHELARAPNLDAAFTSAAASPLFHSIGATHSYM